MMSHDRTTRFVCRWGRLVFLVAMGICFSSTTPALAAANSGPCAADPQSRQLDYWLGNWNVGAAGASSQATSKVYLALDQCLVVESWDGGRGHSGENTFGYSPDDKTWYGMFADNEGRVHIFTHGQVASGVAEFQGTSQDPKGETVLNKVKVVRIDGNRVDQTWEKSTDNGATWVRVFRGEYTRASR
jgi:hypothetical protein